MSTARLLQSYSANWMWRWWERSERSVVRRERQGSNHEVGLIGFPSLPGSHQQSTTLTSLGAQASSERKGWALGRKREREREVLTYLHYLLLYATPCISTPALITRTAMKSKQLAASDCTPAAAAAGKAILICMTSSYSLCQSPLPHFSFQESCLNACMLMYCCR